MNENKHEKPMQSTHASKYGRGKITTVVDLVDRDHQDNFLFPLDTDQSWFIMDPRKKGYPAVRNLQEFPFQGNASWGGRIDFVIDRFSAGDLLQDIILQFTLEHWYSQHTRLELEDGTIEILDSSNNLFAPWTLANSLGSVIIDYAELEIDGVLIERIDGQFITVFYSAFKNVNSSFGLHSDLLCLGSSEEMANNTGMFSPNRPFTAEDGKYVCVLPFFFSRIRDVQTLPIISCKEKSIRFIIQLRPFCEVVRMASLLSQRQSCTDTPINKQVVTKHIQSGKLKTIYTKTDEPILKDVKIRTECFFISENIRKFYLEKPFEQICSLVKTFYFDEPVRYSVSKPNPIRDIIDVQLPLELNHPVKEIIWIFRRKAVQLNNDWCNFSPFTYNQLRTSAANSANINSTYAEWLDHASIVLNGIVLQEADGERFRYQIGSCHSGGFTTFDGHLYGYSFSIDPEKHLPEGTGNMSKAQSVVLNLSVRQPFPVDVPSGFDSNVADGWEIYVYVMYHNWLRFENGICNQVFID